jgi:signal transduction histidine kinase
MNENVAKPKRAWRGPGDWPLVWRLPLAMATLVLLLAVLLTHFGLRELERRETLVRIEVAGAFLDTLAGVIEPVIANGAAPEQLEALLSASARFKPSLRNEVVGACCARDGAQVTTSSYPDGDDRRGARRDTEAALSSWLSANDDLPVGESAVEIVPETAKLLIVQAYPAEPGGRTLLAAAFDLEHERAEQRELRRTAVVLDISLSVLAALVTFLLAQRSLRPIDRLSRALGQEDYDVSDLSDEIDPNTEVGRLQDALRSRARFDARAANLARLESERARESTLARLAAGLAHEVRNPVAGMSAAVSTLRRFGEDREVRDQTIDLIERGLQSIDRVAASMLSTYRPPEGNRDLLPADLEDLKALINPKIRAKHIRLSFRNALSEPFATSADAVRQIALNLLLNATEATPTDGEVRFEARLDGGCLILRVADDGPGLPDDAIRVLTGEGQPKSQRSRRLGLWLVHQLIDDVDGRVAIHTRSEAGTVITITIPARAREGDKD